MPAGGISTFDGNPNLAIPTTQGYRPGDADFNGAALQDLGKAPPNPATMPTAALYNTYSKQLESVSRMIPYAVASVIAAVSPSIPFWRVAANNVTSNPFTLTRVGTGNYQLTLTNPALFPSAVGQATASLNVVLGAHNYAIGVVNISNGVHITTTEDGVLTDLNFTAELF